jgi:hypothetical protein
MFYSSTVLHRYCLLKDVLEGNMEEDKSEEKAKKKT